jgi:hypothetical protein
VTPASARECKTLTDVVPGAFTSTSEYPASRSFPAACERPEVGRGPDGGCDGVIQERRKRRHTGERSAVDRLEPLGRRQDVLGLEPALVSGIERVPGSVDPSQQANPTAEATHGGTSLLGLLLGEHRPIERCNDSCLLGLTARDLDQMSKMADCRVGRVDRPRAVHVDGDTGVDTTCPYRVDGRRIAPDLLRHGEHSQPQSSGLVRKQACIRLDTVEIEHVAVRGDDPLLVQDHGRPHQVRIPSDQRIEEHGSPPIPSTSATPGSSPQLRDLNCRGLSGRL